MGRRIIGKWKVKGGKLCIEAPKPEDSRCKEVWWSGDKYQFRVKGPGRLRCRSAEAAAARVVSGCTATHKRFTAVPTDEARDERTATP